MADTMLKAGDTTLTPIILMMTGLVQPTTTPDTEHFRCLYINSWLHIPVKNEMIPKAKTKLR